MLHHLEASLGIWVVSVDYDEDDKTINTLFQQVDSKAQVWYSDNHLDWLKSASIEEIHADFTATNFKVARVRVEDMVEICRSLISLMESHVRPVGLDIKFKEGPRGNS